VEGITGIRRGNVTKKKEANGGHRTKGQRVVYLFPGFRRQTWKGERDRTDDGLKKTRQSLSIIMRLLRSEWVRPNSEVRKISGGEGGTEPGRNRGSGGNGGEKPGIL